MENKIQSFISIDNRLIQALNQNEILGLIPADTLAKIKETNPHPYFQAFSIAHEGSARPKVLGETEQKPVVWSRRAIQSIKNIVTKGVKFFKRHNKDNSTEGRKDYGEVVADTQKEIDGKLHHIVVGYFPDKEAVKDCDVCSQEANWGLLETAKNFVADTITKLTGIALANSSEELPAFPGAKRLGSVQALQIQAFEYEEISIEANDQTINSAVESGKGDLNFMDLTQAGIRDLLNEVKRRQTLPSQLFSVDDIKADRELRKIFDEVEKQMVEKDDVIKRLEEEKGKLNQDVMTSTASSRFEELLTKQEDPLTDTQKSFINLSFSEKLKGKMINDLSTEGLQKFISDKMIDYKIATSSGIFKTEETNEANIDKTSNSTIDKTDFSNPENNPYLPEDI
jgi:hypothetical protein